MTIDLSRHKPVLTALILVLVAAIVVHMLVIRPLAADVKSDLENQNADISNLTREGFSLDPSKLMQQQSELVRIREDMQGQLGHVYDRAMSQFSERLEIYDTVLGFKKSISQLDYQERFIDLKRQLEERGFRIDEKVLGLSEQTTSPRTYRLVVQLWLVDDILKLASRHNLNVSGADLEDGTLDLYWAKYHEGFRAGEGEVRNLPTRLRVYPVKAYQATSTEEPFVEEFPVRLTATAPIGHIQNFLHDLTADGSFLPVESTIIRKTDVNNQNSDLVEATIICSGFLIQSEKKDFDVDIKIRSKHNVPPPRAGI